MAKKGLPELKVEGRTTVVADRKALEDIRLADGFALPESYCDFASTYGYGVLCQLLIVYIPMGEYGDSLMVRQPELSAMLHDSIDNDLFEYEPDGSPDLVRRLIPFGISENGHTLAWDPKEPTGPRENMIYVVGSKALAVRKGAPDFYSFVERCLDDRVKKMLGSGYKPLPATFRPVKPVGGAKAAPAKKAGPAKKASAAKKDAPKKKAPVSKKKTAAAKKR